MTQTHVIDGKSYAALLKIKIADQILSHKPFFTPELATILVGNDSGSQIYIKNKIKTSHDLGIKSHHLDLPETISEEALLAEIKILNENSNIDGILVQMPLPNHIDATKIINAIDPQKDVDGFHPINAAALYMNQEGLYPCTPIACIYLLKQTLKSLQGLKVLVIGRSMIVGKPLSLMLLHEDATITIAHSQTLDLNIHCLNADVIIAAIGRPHFLRGSWIKPGAVIIDVGINRSQDPDSKKIMGDVCFEEALGHASAITPVPGGVGPMTITFLMYNTLKAACLRRGHKVPDMF
jgi:methylenetetrahydrofolate dehydrogenase (NADP+) / methenyltetrahydrofolate cyclohydrolase